MPVGAIIGGVATIGGALISSSSNSKAIDKASDAQSAATREATQLQRDIYNRNVGYQTPYLNTGNAAMAQMNALLGLNVPQQTGGTNALPTAPVPANTPAFPAFSGQNLAYNMWRQRLQRGNVTLEQVPEQYRQFLAPTTQTPAASAVPAVSQPTAENAYNQFKNYTGYTTRLNEANNAMNSAYAARGTLQSGAALQAMARMNQDYASSEFGNYMGYLGNQQQLGPGAANALSGVGTNYANAAGNLAIQNGNNIANAAVASANNRNQLYSGIAQGIGDIAGSIFGGSSFSDRRLKREITKIGTRSDGLNVYTWIYKRDPSNTVCEGFMADEVKEFYPDAYSEDRHGYGMVNYAAIPAEKVTA